jgi:hypothetical protein
VTELADNDSEYLLDAHTVEVPTMLESKMIEPKSNNPYKANQTQLWTPSITLSIESTSSSSLDSTYIEAQELLAALGNRASCGNEILGDLNPQNIVEGLRTQTSSRKAAYAIALGKNNELGGYHLSFVTAIKAELYTKPLRLH